MAYSQNTTAVNKVCSSVLSAVSIKLQNQVFGTLAHQYPQYNR